MKKFVCPQCEEVTYTYSNHRAHMMLHSDERHVCDECGYQTRYSTNLIKHRKKVHGRMGSLKKENEQVGLS